MRPLTAVTGLVRRALGRSPAPDGVRGVIGGPAAGPRPPLLPVNRAYALWAASYGAPPNLMQALDASARAGLSTEVEGARVLDLGCGTGRLAYEALAEGAATVVGLDPSLPMLREAQARGHDASAADRGHASSGQAAIGARGGRRPEPPAGTGSGVVPVWLAGDGARLPFRSAAFDVVTCALVLAHIPDPAPAIAEIARVLGSGGRLVLSDFHPAATARGWDRTFSEPGTGRTLRVEHHPHSIEGIRALLECSGFRVEAFAEREHEGTPVVFAIRAARGEGR